MYDFVLARFENLREEDIVILGRSMGSAPTFHLAATRKPAAIIAMSAFSSIKNVISDKLSFLGRLVNKDYFNNLEKAA